MSIEVKVRKNPYNIRSMEDYVQVSVSHNKEQSSTIVARNMKELGKIRDAINNYIANPI